MKIPRKLNSQKKTFSGLEAASGALLADKAKLSRSVCVLIARSRYAMCSVDQNTDEPKLFFWWEPSSPCISNIEQNGLFRLNTTIIHYFLGYMFWFLQNRLQPVLTIGRYSQCVHTLWNLIVFT